jgi:hypothetical protein
MGLKGYGSWVNLIQRAEPHHAVDVDDGRVVAAQVECGKQRFEATFSLYRRKG